MCDPVVWSVVEEGVPFEKKNDTANKEQFAELPEWFQPNSEDPPFCFMQATKEQSGLDLASQWCGRLGDNTSHWEEPIRGRGERAILGCQVSRLTLANPVIRVGWLKVHDRLES
jgi:hypothetical protein